MLQRLTTLCPDNYVYYFDVSFDETVRRHFTKPNAHEFGPKEMREWYQPRQLSGLNNEQIIPESFSADQTVALIMKQTGL